MDRLLVPLFVAGFLPYIFTLFAKAGAFGRRDNHRTRDWAQEQTGWRKRAYWAQSNTFEIYPIFASSLLVAYMRAPTSSAALALAWAFIGLRLLYGACYIADWASTRSVVWFGSIACVIGLFVIGARWM